jgi:hypothetical protein
MEVLNQENPDQIIDNESFGVKSEHVSITINDEPKQLIQNKDKNIQLNDSIYFKFIITIFFTLLLCPFPICDIYYACTDISCIKENSHNLDIILQSYLLASGIISIAYLAIFNFTMCIIDFNTIEKNDKSYIFEIILYIFNIILIFFQIAWLILGCVLFWGYTDLFKCSQSVYDYLFTRFILGIIFTSLKMHDLVNNKN